MIFDNEAQKQRVLDLIGEVPIHTTIAGLVSGPSPELAGLLASINNGLILSPDDQTSMSLWMRAREKVGAREPIPPPVMPSET